jgi:hypothetical protein
VPVVTQDFHPNDVIRQTRFSTKLLINLAQGMPDNTKVPSDVILGLLVPTDPQPVTRSKLVVFNTTSKTVLATIADLPILKIITEPGENQTKGVGAGRATLRNLVNAEHNFSISTPLFGSAQGLRSGTADAPFLSVRFFGLHCRLISNEPNFVFRDGLIEKGELRINSGPITQVDLP